MAPPLFSRLKFYVLPVNALDIPRRAELVALLKAHGGEAVPRLEAVSLGAAVMRLVVDAFAVPDKDTGIVRAVARRMPQRHPLLTPCFAQDFYDAQWAFASAAQGALLDREPYRLKPRAAVPQATGAKRKYLRCAARAGALITSVFETARRAPRPRPRRRYTAEDDAALRAFVAARPGLKCTGLKIWQQAFEQQITQHSVWSMKERYATVRAARQRALGHGRTPADPGAARS